MENEKWFAELITAIDGHTAATRAEAEDILSLGFMPFDKFIAEVKRELDKKIHKEQRATM